MLDFPLPNSSKIAPLTRRHRVPWGDCDPAGIIYTPRALDYAMETLEVWSRDTLDISWLKLHRELSTGLMTLRTEIDFLSAPTADDVVVLELRVEKLGGSSLVSVVSGHDGSGRDYFRVKIISCLVSIPEHKPKQFSGEFRQRILAYQATCRDNN